MPILRASLVAVVVCGVVAGTTPAGQQNVAPAASAAAPRRVVAIGDLHADLDVARRVFRLAGATDARDRWIGGDLVIVQLGDLIGRGDEDRPVLDFIFDVRAKAAAAGGTVHVLLGNHEVFGARLDYRWVSPDAYPAFQSVPGLDVRHPRLVQLPPEQRARGAALMPGGVYAKRLAAFPAVLRLGGTIFVHGGVVPLWAEYGLDRINAEVRQWLLGRGEEPAPTLGLDDGSADDGVMWSRHFAAAPESMACPMLDESLRLLGARRMIVAHTVLRAITSRCGGRVWAIDVGMSRYYGGEMQILEILDDERLSVLRASGADRE